MQPVAREEVPMEEPQELDKPAFIKSANQQYEEPPSEVSRFHDRNNTNMLFTTVVNFLLKSVVC